MVYVIRGKTYQDAEVEQAKSLIFRGKAGAVRGDPRLQGLVNSLLEQGDFWPRKGKPDIQAPTETIKRILDEGKEKREGLPTSTKDSIDGERFISTKEGIKRESEIYPQKRSLQDITKPPKTPFSKYFISSKEESESTSPFMSTKEGVRKEEEVYPLFETEREIDKPVGLQPGQSAITPTTRTEFDKPYHTGFWFPGIVQVGKNIGKNILSGEWLDSSKWGTPQEKDVFRPLSYSGSGEARIGMYSQWFTGFAKEKGWKLPTIKRDFPFVGFVDEDLLQTWEFGMPTGELYRKVREKKEKRYKKEYEDIFQPIQEQVTSGKISLEEGKEILEPKFKSIEKRYSKEVSEATSPITTSGKLAQKLVPTTLETGAIIGISLVSPMAVMGYGAFQVVKGGERQDFLEVVGGATLVGLGGVGTVSKVEKEIVGLELEQLAKKPPEWGSLKLRSESLTSKRYDTDILSGIQKSRGLKTEWEAIGKVEYGKAGAFTMPKGYVSSKTTGTLSWDLYGTGKGTQVTSVEFSEIGAKGIGFRLGESEVWSGTMGKTGTETIRRSTFIFPKGTPSKTIEKELVKRTIKDEGKVQQSFFGAISKRISKDTYLTRGGELEGAVFQPKTRKALFEFDARGLGITKVIDMGKVKGVTTYDIVSKGSDIGTKTRVIKPTNILQSTTEKMLVQPSKTISKVLSKTATSQKLSGGLMGTTPQFKQVYQREFPQMNFGVSIRQIPSSKRIFKTNQGVKKRLGVGVTSGLSFAQLLSSQEKLGIGLSSSQLQGLSLKQLQGLSLKQKQLQKLALTGMSITPLTTPKLGFDFGRPIGGLGAGWILPGFEYKEKPKKRQSKGRGFRYQPGLFAIATGYKAPKPSEWAIRTGIITRPIIKRKEKGRNKK